MLNDEQYKFAKPKVLTLQLIAGAMFLGAALFVGSIAMIADWSKLAEPSKMITWFAVTTAIMMYLIAFGAPMLFPKTPSVAGKGDADRTDPGVTSSAIKEIFGLMTTETIVRFALIQGGIALNVMVLMLEPRWLGVIAIGIGFLLMLVFAPRRSPLLREVGRRLESWSQGAN